MSLRTSAALACLVSLAACAAPPPAADRAEGPARYAAFPAGSTSLEQVLRGRRLVINRDCGSCHGGAPNPAAPDWLAGRDGEEPFDRVGEFRMWPANLTPDPLTGVGRYSERQIFNALRYGLRPSATPDVQITSAVPGEGGHPARPDYLSPAMPWLHWRHMTDQELWDIAAYLKHGVRPVAHRTPTNDAPPDRWASQFTPAQIGTHLLAGFPTANEELRDPARRELVLQGRALVASTACSACHGGALHPDREGWLSGARTGRGAPTDAFQIGPFKTYPRNLTPDNATGLGRFSERQLFNALRYGLRPGETPDVEITSTVPGQGNHPANPKYLAPPMPWPAWRHLSDEELWAMVAYLKHGLRPVRNRVPDSEGPPDFWASAYTVEKIGPYPAAPFPTAREEYRP